MTKAAVVTGGAGFIGSHTVDALLERGYEVRVIDDLSHGRRENLSHRSGDPKLKLEILDLRKLVPSHPVFRGAEFVIHFGGIGDIVPSIDRPLEYLSVNVMGTVHALEAARAAGVKKFVYAASSSCYGKDAPVPTSEAAAIAPEYPYALSKFMGEEAVRHWQKVYGLPTVSIRIFNAYGTRSRTTGAYGAVFKVFLAQKLAGKPYTVVGDGTQRRDFVYVTDVARAFVMAAESQRQNVIYNLGADKPQTVNRLVELLGGPTVRLPKRPGEPDCTWADIFKIKRELGWQPEVTFEQGVAEMLKNIDHWRDAPVWDPDSIREATKNWFGKLEKVKK